MISHPFELEMMRNIHQYRTVFLDSFFKFLNYFDRIEFYLVLIPLLWVIKGPKMALRIFYVLAINSLLNFYLKHIFLSPRPFHLDPKLAIIKVSSYGFPSGAAQLVILLSGILVTSIKASWKWPLAFSYIALISFSRIYLGVHFPTDILAGWVVGFLLWFAYDKWALKLENSLLKLPSFALFLLSVLVPCFLFFMVNSSSHFLLICTAALGLSLGAFLASLNKASTYPNKTLLEIIVSSVFVLITSLGLYVLLKELAVYRSFHGAIEVFLVAIWVSFGGQIALNLLGRLFAKKVKI